MVHIGILLMMLCPQDTVFKEAAIDEVVVSSSVGTGKKAVSKGRVASIDEHLGQLSKVEMVRRGNYAWEPVVNNMATERVSTTIDGMKIYIEAEGGVRMAARNSHCGAEYGETPTPGYAVWHLNIGSHFMLGKVATDLHLGIENLFDRYYSTYSDWNHIPQKGRNIYVNVTFQIPTAS